MVLIIVGRRAPGIVLSLPGIAPVIYPFFLVFPRAVVAAVDGVK